MIKEDEIPEIAKRLRELRKSNGLSQRELADRAGVTAPAITLWETGKRFPRGANLKRLAKALRVTESYILDGPNSQNEENRPVDPTELQELIRILGRLDRASIRTLLADARDLLSPIESSSDEEKSGS